MRFHHRHPRRTDCQRRFSQLVHPALDSKARHPVHWDDPQYGRGPGGRETGFKHPLGGQSGGLVHRLALCRLAVSSLYGPFIALRKLIVAEGCSSLPRVNTS